MVYYQQNDVETYNKEKVHVHECTIDSTRTCYTKMKKILLDFHTEIATLRTLTRYFNRG